MPEPARPGDGPPAPPLAPAVAAEQFRRACTLDVAVRKPGNVSAASPGE